MQPSRTFFTALIAMSLIFVCSSLPAQDAMALLSSKDISHVFAAERFSTPDGEGGWYEQERAPVLGFLGDDYHRLYIHFISVIKNTDNPTEYFVYGKSRFKGTICAFAGTLQLTAAEEYVEPEYPDQRQGSVKGTYRFDEDQKQRHTGIFAGEFTAYWRLDENGNVVYNGLLFGMDDGYSNNAFTGTWTSHRTGKGKVCNWGDYRIPDSGMLDLGAGEFSPNEDYRDNGWRSYYLMFSGATGPEADAARREERERWWE